MNGLIEYNESSSTKSIERITHRFTWIFVVAILAFGCGKGDEEPTPLKNPKSTITLKTISPDSGSKGTIVTIIGSNFGTDTTMIKVFFNNMKAKIQAVSDTTITAVVPKRAMTGNVKLVIAGSEVIGPEFVYILTPDVSTLAGGIRGFADGAGTDAQFSHPFRVALDISGNVYVSDSDNYKIRKITPNGIVSTLAGSTRGFADGPGVDAKFDGVSGLVVDDLGNVYVADEGNHVIRKITPDGSVSTFAGARGITGFQDGLGTNARFKRPKGLAIDAAGNLYVTDFLNHSIRKISPDGMVSTLAGSTQGFVDGAGVNAKFDRPMDLALDALGNVFVADTFNDKIRKITPEGIVSTFAGSTHGFENGVGSDAKFFSPFGVTVDEERNLYVTDDNTIRKVTVDGVVSTYIIGDFRRPSGLAIDAHGSLYVADFDNHIIRKVTQE